jgi:isocitrate lyase
MPELKISLDDEQKQFEAEVAAIEKQWSSPRQAHLKRSVSVARFQVAEDVV